MSDQLEQSENYSVESDSSETLTGQAMAQGDPTVGIARSMATFDTGIFRDVFEEGEIDREEIRDLFANLYSQVFDEAAWVTFDDECPDCCTVRPKHTQNCPAGAATNND